MATTTNYSWTTPDDTDLVKDGASAIRTLGSSVDTTVKALSPGTTAGDIDYYTTSTAKARVAIGTAGQVLTVNSGATAPQWSTPVSGAYTLLATATPSAATTISFTSISAGYKHLFLTWHSIFQSSNTTFFYTRLNNDATSKYFTQTVSNNAGTVVAYNDGLVGQIGTIAYDSPIGTTSTNDTFTSNSSGHMWIYDYADTTVRKLITYGSTASGKYPIFANAEYNSTSAIDRVDFIRNSTQTLTGKMYLFGVK
jgi:hypothetical protein